MIDIRQLPNLSIEQKDFVNQFYAAFDYAAPGSGLNRHITNVEPVLYIGLSNGMNLQAYDATRLWLVFSIIFTHSLAAAANAGLVTFYDETGAAINNYSQNQSICYDSVAPAINYTKNDALMKNLWFSRYLDNQYNYVKIVGYRITLD